MDDLALAGMLRSPAFGLSDAALYHLCQRRAGEGASLWEILRDLNLHLHVMGLDLTAQQGEYLVDQVVQREHLQLGTTTLHKRPHVFNHCRRPTIVLLYIRQDGLHLLPGLGV